MRVAVLEDDQAQAELLASWIRASGHEPYSFATGESFKNALKRDTYDLLLMDWNLPDTSGLDVLQWVRDNIDWHIPVLFTTSRDNERDVVYALENGADDYMTKPMRRAETLARIRALERRLSGQLEEPDILSMPPYRIDPGNRRISRDGEELSLTQREFDLALFLFRNAGRLLSRSYILENVWGHKGELNTRTVDTHVSRVRSKLGIGPANGWRLSAVYHHGYRLESLHNPSNP